MDIKASRSGTEEQQRAQEAINAMVEREATVGEIRAAIVQLADDAHKGFPQYVDYWSGDEWKIGVVTEQVKTKGGIRFERGDTVLYRADETMTHGFVTAYSVRGGIACSIFDFTITALAVRAPAFEAIA